MTEDLALSSPQSTALSFGDSRSFDHIQRVAKCLSESQLVPVVFQKNIPNVIIALEISQRINASPLMVMQNLNIIHGKPSFGASFMIAAVNACGRFTPLRFIQVGTPGSDDWGCYAIAKAKIDGFECKGVTVTIAIAKAEGWFGKSGSKWKTMPELMLQYRAGTWWSRAFAPELLMGFSTAEEMTDVHAEPAAPGAEGVATPGVTVASPVVERKPRKGVAGAKAEPLNVTGSATEDAAVAAAVAGAVPTTAATDTLTGPAKDIASELTPPPVDNAHVAPGAEQFTGPAATTPAPQAPAAPVQAAPTCAKRCELVTIIETQAKKANGVVGPMCTVTLKGEYEGVAYFDGAATALPAVGAVGNATMADRTLKGTAVKILVLFEVLA